jgi:hypothetical protein
LNALAFSVVETLIGIAAVYCVEEAVGSLPSVV